MNFAVMFNLLLTLLTAATGVCWLLDKFWLAKRRKALYGGDALPGATFEFFRGLFPVIAAVFVVRSFLFEPFRIPSGSMIPTLHVGDFILVNKFGYGLRCPIGSCKLVDIGEPKRGDVIVFKFPKDPTQDYIKRLIGLPGDKIHYENKTLTINGETMPLTPAKTNDDARSDDTRMHENLGGIEHDTLAKLNRISDSYSCPFVQPNPDEFDFEVPAGSYFMMGDNRDGSNDSRCWGTVPEANLKGRATLIWMSWNSEKFKIELSRIGTLIR